MKGFRLVILLITLCCSGKLWAQDDKKSISTSNLFSPSADSVSKDSARRSVAAKPVKRTDTLLKQKHDPRKATFRSAVLPGWGQAYNKEYWKIPIVYGILAIPTTLFFYNNSYYKKTKFAYEAHYKAQQLHDSSDLSKIDPELANLSITSLQNYRNVFRRDRDYSIVWFVLAWGLQVADATVFAHLKDFDVSTDLSMQVNPSFNPFTKMPSLTVALNLKNSSSRKLVTR